MENNSITMSHFSEIRKDLLTLNKIESTQEYLDSHGYIVIKLDVDGTVLFVNEETCNVLGFHKDEILGKNWNDNFIKSNMSNKIASIPKEGLNKENPHLEYFENEILTKCQHIRVISWKSLIVRDDIGRKTGQLNVGKDITKLKNKELALESISNQLSTFSDERFFEDRYRGFVENTSVGFYQTTPDGEIITANRALLKMLNFDSIEDLRTRKLNNEGYVDSHKRNEFAAIIEKEGIVRDFVSEWYSKDGNVVYVKEGARAVRDEAGKLCFYEGSVENITDLMEIQKKLIESKEELQESESKFRELYEKSGDAILMIKNGIFVDCNQATIDMLNYQSKSEFLNVHPSKLSPEFQPNGQTSMEKAEEMMALASHKGTHRFEWIHLKKDDVEFPVEVLLTMILNEPKNKIIHVVWRDITERKKAQIKLIKAKEKAEESDKLKTEFLNNMSHEIRTPMNGILGFSNLLQDENLSYKKRKNYIQIIENSSHQLLHIIDDILEISELGTKQVKLNEKKCNLNDLMVELFSVFNLKFGKGNIPLYLHKDLRDEHSEILLDRVKLHKVLINLLENAFKFTNSGQINFGYQISKERIEFFVRDTGIGIKEDHLDTIFKRFSQADKELSKKVGGLGLGLSIAKENVTLLGGTLNVESELLVGSTFRFDIPYKPFDLGIEITDKDSNEDIENSLTFLIAEDEEVNFMFLEIILNQDLKLNCQIIHAINGKEAVAFCEANANIDLVLMDLKMPVMTGFEAAKQIKEFRPGLPIIGQSAYSSSKDIKRAKDAGCDDYISKPIKKKLLKEILSKYILSLNAKL